jgi:glycosyltransferase involved in cell wall biosynthesis
VDRALLRPLHLPVENRVSKPRQHVLDHDRSVVTIGHVGGMIALRDQATLIRAVGVLRAKGVDARLIMVGDGPERAALEALAVSLQLRPWITFAGYQTNLESFYECIDIYANPAIGEGFGIAVVEAMLASKPVVLANAGAHPELIEDGLSGLLHQPGSSQSLADTLEMLISDPVRLKQITIAARDRAEKLFSPQKYATQFEAIVAHATRADMTSRSYDGHRAF